MNPAPAQAIKAVLCDIEGTTTSLSFVHDVLFPLSRKEMDRFVHENWNDPELGQLFAQTQKQSPDEVIQLLKSWINADKKEGILKQIQGKIWKRAFESGQIRAHVYPDVSKKWNEWKDHGIKVYIFSSGSIEAQQLLFRFSEMGDLTGFIDGYFDTATGPKKDPESYRMIARVVQLPPKEMLFLSDVPAELDAARDAGLQTVLIVRSGHDVAKSFEDIPL